MNKLEYETNLIKDLNKELFSEIIPKHSEKLQFDLLKHSAILSYRGSLTNGTYIPDSIDDIDIIGIIIPPIEYVLGNKQFGSRDTIEIKDGKWDIVLYSIKKFFNLLVKNNPNIVSVLWLPERFDIHINEIGIEIIKHREEFINKNIYNSFLGYANDQLNRMTKFTFEGYMGEKRKQLVYKYGFDCKNASHLIRLLKMALEVIVTKKFIVYRENDADELVAIKRGDWSIEKVKKYANDLFASIELLRGSTQLPDENYDAANKLLIELSKKFYRI
jgi:predicted nucleotidyltransferase